VPLDLPNSTTFCIGEWTVDPLTGEIARGEQLVRLEERPLRLLLCLAEHAGEVLSIDELLRQVWQGVVVSPDSIYQAITSLRRQLGDDPKRPTYIATVPRRGYRLVATVTPPAPARAPAVREPAPQQDPTLPRLEAEARPARLLLLVIALLALVACLIAIPLFDWYAAPDLAAVVAPPPAPPSRSVAVLTFVDLTDQMSEEPFADGMAEQLIDTLSKVPGLAVAPGASSYHLGEKKTVGDIARALNVAYVLDGSVRKSGATLRVSARLMRASDGFIVWSDTYDRAWSDKLMIQDDIAGKVGQALAKSIH
jgi:transcriptional activator of cad operon